MLTKDEVIEKIRQIKRDTGQINYYYIKKNYRNILRPIEKHFKKIDNALIYAGFNPKIERKIHPAQHRLELSKKEKEILDGLILSDAHLTPTGTKGGKNSRLCFHLKYESFCDLIMNGLQCFHWKKKFMLRFDSRTQKFYNQWSLESRVHPYLTTQRTRWYIKNTKIVPKDLILTKNVLLWWYLGDGCLERKKARPNSRRIILSTNCFTKNDNWFLIDELKKIIGNNNVYQEGDQIVISRQSLCNFIEIVGSSSPVECYNYKFEFGQYVDKNYFEKSFSDTFPF